MIKWDSQRKIYEAPCFAGREFWEKFGTSTAGFGFWFPINIDPWKLRSGRLRLRSMVQMSISSLGAITSHEKLEHRISWFKMKWNKSKRTQHLDFDTMPPILGFPSSFSREIYYHPTFFKFETKNKTAIEWLHNKFQNMQSLLRSFTSQSHAPPRNLLKRWFFSSQPIAICG